MEQVEVTEDGVVVRGSCISEVGGEEQEQEGQKEVVVVSTRWEEEQAGTVGVNERWTRKTTTVAYHPLRRMLGASVKASKLMGMMSVRTQSPLEIARQMTLLQHSLYEVVPVTEFLNMNFQHPETRAPHFLRLKMCFNSLTLWMMNRVLAEDEVLPRAEVLGRVIEVADYCLTVLQNFDGVMAVVNALEDNAIFRLKDTWAKLDKKSRKKWEPLKEVAAMGARKLSAIMQASESPCVPYVGLHLKSLVTLNEYPSRLCPESGSPDEGGPELINFGKLRSIGAVIEEVLRHQRVPYTFDVQPHLQLFLSLPPDYVTKDDCYQRSLEIEPRR